MKTLVLVASALLWVSSAAAQDKPKDKPKDAVPDPTAAGSEATEMPEDDAEPVGFEDEGDAPHGASEDPDAPVIGKAAGDDGEAPAAAAYAGEFAQRPILLQGGALQVRYFGGVGGLTEKRAYRFLSDDDEVDSYLRAGGVLSVEYGITSKVQVGLHYGTGTFGKVETAAEPAPDATYVTGKTVAVELHYGLEDWVALQLELPMLLDPFNMAATIGAPMKFRFGDKLALLVGEDLVTFRFNDFVPFVPDAVANARAVALVEDEDIEQDNGDITVKLGALYQLSPKAALQGTFGIVAADFGTTDAGAPLWGDLFYAISPKIDLQLRAGFGNLGAVERTFVGAAGFALRI
jgi:hypothetical protein